MLAALLLENCFSLSIAGSVKFLPPMLDLTMAKNSKPGELSGLAMLTAGFVLVGMTAGGTFIGYLIGRALGAVWVGAIIGLILGTAIGFYDLYQMAVRIFSRQSMPNEAEQERARENWESSDEKKSSDEEGNRDVNHE